MSEAEEQETQEPEIHTFQIKNGQQVTEVEGRMEAIAQAKEVSARTWRPVGLEREDGRVKMNFRDGALVDYVFEPRKGRRA